jgi:hypothetical protein
VGPACRWKKIDGEERECGWASSTGLVGPAHLTVSPLFLLKNHFFFLFSVSNITIQLDSKLAELNTNNFVFIIFLYLK